MVGASLILTVVVAVSIGLSKLTVGAQNGIAGAGWVNDDAAGVGNGLSRSQIAVFGESDPGLTIIRPNTL